MPENQNAGGDVVNVNVAGDDNKVVVVRGLSDLRDEISDLVASRKYRVLVCGPSPRNADHAWHGFCDKLLAALRGKNFEVIVAGSGVPRDADELIYVAEQRHLNDRNCHALLVLACDYVTVSQLTHLTSVAFKKDQLRKDIVAVYDASLINDEQYFGDGALKAIEVIGKIFPFASGKIPQPDLIDEIVKRFSLMRATVR
ncbi:hypothetical protein ACS0ZG_07025 [Burkholderia gladioli]|uniref:hypothetical protein n=1 Tax=Burkholderia gladioli TaxID=28095 RepID=UPI000AF6FCED|nr:hypothetical protein [Burkholderia gladioli]